MSENQNDQTADAVKRAALYLKTRALVDQMAETNTQLQILWRSCSKGQRCTCAKPLIEQMKTSYALLDAVKRTDRELAIQVIDDSLESLRDASSSAGTGTRD